MPIFASIYLNVFVIKRCENFTFADPSIFYITKFNKRAKNCSTTTAKTLKVMSG